MALVLVLGALLTSTATASAWNVPGPGVEERRVPSLSGRVLDAAGRPLSGARVSLARPLSWTGSESGLPTVETGASGSFTLRAPELGSTPGSAPGHAGLDPTLALDVHVERPGFAPELLPAPLGGRELTIALGAPSRLAGRVLDDRGAAVADAEVRLVRAWSDGGHYRLVDADRTDASGRYAFEQLPGGRYLVEIRPLELPAAVMGTDLSSGERVERDVMLHLGRRLRARLLDERGQPVVGARVRAVSRAAAATAVSPLAELGLGVAQASSDAQGRFVLALGERDSQTGAQLEITAAGFATRTVALEQLAQDAELRLRASSPATAVEAATPRPSAATTWAADTVRGLVVDVRGAPIGSAGVLLRSAGQPTRLAIADASGRFAFEGVDSQVCALWITPPTFDQAPGVHAIGLGSVRPGKTPLEVVLPPAAWTAGRVVDRRGQPVSGARVRAWGARDSVLLHDTTGPDGTFGLRLPIGTRADLELGGKLTAETALLAVPAGARDLELVVLEGPDER